MSQQFDQDDLEDYANEDFSDEELSPEEEEKLAVAFAQVKSLLGDRKIDDQTVKDAVWHYYSDVDKASKYLIEKYDKEHSKSKLDPKPKSKISTPPSSSSSTTLINNDSSSIKESFNSLSPDDVVLNAQSKAKGFGVPLDKKLESLRVSDTPKTVKKINVVEQLAKVQDNKPSINFVVIGHVDAGKSTLMGRLLYEVGVIDQHVIDRYKRDSERLGKGSFAFAWVLDQTEEERNRGVTIDIFMSSFETSKAKFTILDAPGHKDFVPNMIAGSAQADLAVLVVDSSTDAFESGFHLDGQTKEHTILVRSLGIEKLVVAVNKLDNVQWSRDRFNEIRVQLLEFLIKVGFKESSVDFVPCSGLLGENVLKKSNLKELEWYEGRSLIELLGE